MEQSKRVGRPPVRQEGQEEAKQTTVSRTSKPLISHSYKEEEGPKAVVYHIEMGGGIAYMLSQSSVTVYDKDSDTVRQIRYCPNERSIFVDEQSQNAKKEAIIFRDGYLVVPVDKPNLRHFMEAHPANKANGGSTYHKVDNKVNIEKELEKEFNVFDSVSLVKDKSIDELLPVAIFYGVNVNRPVSDIKYDLLRIAKSKPHEFVSSFDNPIVKTRSLVFKASEYNVVTLKPDGCYWTDSNNLIVAVPVGQDPLDTLTRFCMTERGSSVLLSIEDHMSNT
jgi:hypothetical protein